MVDKVEAIPNQLKFLEDKTIQGNFTKWNIDRTLRFEQYSFGGTWPKDTDKNELEKSIGKFFDEKFESVEVFQLGVNQTSMKFFDVLENSESI